MSNENFDWDHARTLLGVLEHGSLLAAAKAMRCSQPTVSRRILELERRLGVVLFARTSTGLKPTSAAVKLAGPARAMAEQANTFLRLAGAEDRGLAGPVRITASQPVACSLLPPILKKMRQLLPEVVVELVVSNAVTDLLSRDADMALRMVRPQQNTLIARRLRSVDIRACAHRDYLRERGTPQTAEDLRQHLIVASDKSRDLERGAAVAGFPGARLQAAIRTDDLIAQWESVRAGLGIGFMPRYMIATDPAVREILPDLKIEPLPLWLVVHREIRTSHRIRRVFDFLAQSIPQVLAGDRQAPALAGRQRG